MQPTIRRAAAVHQPAIRALMRGERVNPTGVDWRNFVVAETDRAIVGAAQLRPSCPGVVELGSLVVRADLRRNGLGARLIDAALAEAGSRRVMVVAPARHAAFYARWGFAPLPARRAPWPVLRNWLLGQAGSLVALAHGMRPRRLAVLDRPGGDHGPDVNRS